MKLHAKILLLLISITILSCQKEQLPVPKNNIQNTNISANAARNPYYMENIRDAFQQLGYTDKVQILKPTHVYVKLLLKSSDEFTYLSHNNIDISSTPMDDFQPQIGSKISNINKQYAIFYGVFPIDFQPIGIKYEKLYDLYIPDATQYEAERKSFELLGLPVSDKSAQTQNGNIVFNDPISHENIPLAGVKVVIRQFVKKFEGLTDNYGHFEIQGQLINQKSAVSVSFDNAFCEIRNFTIDNIFELFAPINYTLGNFDIGKGLPINITIDASHNNDPMLQTAAAALSALNTHRKFSDVFGYIKPQKKMNIWIAKDALLSSSYAAPMLRNIALQHIFNIKLLVQRLFNLPSPIANSLSKLVKNDLPDIYAPYYSSYNLGVYPSFTEALLHEFSHSVHYAKVGNDYWTTYIQHIYENGGYGDGLEAQSGLVALSEAWAEDLSLQCAKWNYGDVLYNETLLDANTSPSYNWIPWGLYYDLNDDANNENWDEVSNISFNSMYSIFSAEINTPQKFKAKLKLNLNADSDMANKIDVLFAHYGF